MINIYGPQDSSAKSFLWNRIADFMRHHKGKFILFGDMNVVRNKNERFGSIFSQIEADHFNSFIDLRGLIDLLIGGRLYTWMNKAGTKLSKLDRFLISDEVLEISTNIHITALDRLCFDDVIKAVWSSLENNNNDGRILKSHEKLRSLKAYIKQWYVNFNNIDRNPKHDAMSDVILIEKRIDDGIAIPSHRGTRMQLLQEIDKLDNFEALDLIQWAHIKWDIEGDENSKFFRWLINQKMRYQSIKGIMHDGVWTTDPIHIKELFLNFFKDKFQVHDSQVVFPPLVHSTCLCPIDSEYLENHVFLNEIKSAIWGCGSNKASDPDGFTFTFVSNPIFIKDFRPISLIGIHYKIIAKILANWLSKVIDKIVSIEKSAFISGRQILDGPLILSEVIECLGFGNKWRSWIRAYLHSSRASVLVNGILTSELSIKRGLRQGDPLSPFLFILVIEGLHCALSTAVSSNLIHRINLGSPYLTLSHLFYSDDVIITTKWNLCDLDNIIRVLHVFYLASGLKININKCNIYGIGVSDDEVSNMARNSGCAAGSFPFTYLRLPIGSTMNCVSSWKTLIDRFQ
ncbi:putative RNA-directed DNA polymerase, eukaryota, reverse transcriptase zinc-binding domain protein [Tanacetum coccineum]